MEERSGTRRLSPQEAHAFWTSEAERHGLSPSASWSDRRVMELEVRAIGPHVAGARTLDVGCANGWSSTRFAADYGADVTGVDYVEEMVANAIERQRSLPEEVRRRTAFQVGDVRELAFDDDSFERVVSTRVIINLGGWDEQQRGLRECLRVLRPGGLLLLSEATVGGWRRLNALRAEWGLEEIPVPPFNTYLDEEEVVELLAADADLLRLEDFASSYYVATRVLKPLLASVAPPDAPIDVADPESELNRWAASLPAAGDYGTQKLFVFSKRAA
jgi:ubiquinone/menaquinone biosynthesis C-methylase UbiE